MVQARLLRAVRIVAIVGGITGVLSAQTPASPAFEAASVKPHQSADQQTMMVVQPGGRFVATNIPLLFFIRTAYRLQDDQIVGGPGWLNSDRFDIVAKADAGGPVQVCDPSGHSGIAGVRSRRRAKRPNTRTAVAAHRVPERRWPSLPHIGRCRSVADVRDHQDGAGHANAQRNAHVASPAVSGSLCEPRGVGSDGARRTF